MNPGHVVAIEDFSRETLDNVVAHLEASTSFEHCVYRESELDAVCRLIELAIERERGSASEQELARLTDLLRAARDAHDLVADEQPSRAAARLREALT